LVGASTGEKKASRTPLLTLGFVALLIYVYVIHSYKLPLAQAAMIVGVLSLLVQGRPVRFPPGSIWYAAFLVWGILFYTASLYSNDVPALWWEAVKLPTIMVVVANVLGNSRQIRAFIVFWLAVYALYPVRGILFNFVFRIHTSGRYAWNFIFQNPNEFACFTLLPLGLCVAIARSNFSKSVRWAAAAGVLVLTVTIFLTQSRAGLIGLATFGLMVLATERRRFRVIAVGAVLTGVVLFTAPPEVWKRLGGLSKLSSAETIGEADPEGSAAARFAIMRVAWAVFKEHPVTGVGFGVYEEAHADYMRHTVDRSLPATVEGPRDTHNAYLRVLAESGVVGLALFLAWLFQTFAYLVRAVRRVRLRDETHTRQLQVLTACWAGYWVAALFGGLNRAAFPFLFAGVMYALAEHYMRGGDPGTVADQPAGRIGFRGTRAAPAGRRRI
jgi:O-antigen ligase